MKRPTAACILLIVGGVIILLGELFIISALLVAMALMPGMITHFLIVMRVVIVVFGILAFVGAALIWGGIHKRVRIGSIIGLISGVACLLLGGGFFIGPLLVLIGGILGLIWKPPTTAAQPAQQPAQLQQ